MTTPSVRLTDSGYWHVRWNPNQWFQWPRGRAPKMSDGFGWLNEEHRAAAEQMAIESERAKGGEGG